MKYEILDVDALGRIGKLEVNNKQMVTPNLFPVVHPFKNVIPPSDLKNFGAQSIFTNAYILFQNDTVKENVLKKKIHQYLDFDGLIATDSGAFQQYMYNTSDMKIEAEEIEKFQEKISLSDHQKAADYSVTKIKAGQFFQIFDFVLLLIWTLGGGLEALDRLARSFQFGELTTGLVFFLSFGFISLILGLPQSIYVTFVIEEKFGFNKTTPKIFILDRIKGIIISLIIGPPIILLILWLMKESGKNWDICDQA